MEQKTNVQTEGNPWRILILFSLPLMAGNIFQQMYTVVDTAVVGKVLGVDALAALAAGLCVYIPISLGITLSFYLALDFPEKTGKETLALCWHVMKGQRMRLFLLELGFLPLMLLCILSFGIGFLWLQPYMQMTHTCFFLDLMNPRKVSS